MVGVCAGERGTGRGEFIGEATLSFGGREEEKAFSKEGMAEGRERESSPELSNVFSLRPTIRYVLRECLLLAEEGELFRFRFMLFSSPRPSILDRFFPKDALFSRHSLSRSGIWRLDCLPRVFIPGELISIVLSFRFFPEVVGEPWNMFG